MKNKKILQLGILACVLIAVLAIALKSCLDGGESGETQADETEASDDNAATASDAENEDEIEMSDELYRLLSDGFSVQYNGMGLTFPCDYAEILGDVEEWDVHGNGLYDSAVAFGKDDLSYEVALYIPVEATGDLDTLEEAGCSGIGISMISLEDSFGEDEPEFSLAGITWLDTEEDIRDTFGEPGYRNDLTEDNGVVIYTYLLYQAEYEDKLYSVEFTIEDGYGVVAMSFYFIESEAAGSVAMSEMSESAETDLNTDECTKTLAAADEKSEATTTLSGSSTDSEEPEGTTTIEAEAENEAEEASVSATTAAQKSENSTTTQNSAGSTATTTGKTGTTTAAKAESGTTAKETQTTTAKKSTTTTTKAAETTTTAAASTTTRTYATEEEKLAIIEGINNYRASQGYTEMPVVLNTFLTEQAQEWADYLAANDICESSMEKNAMSNLTGDYYWSREYYGEVKLLGKEISSWISRGEDVGKNGFYDCPFVGVGVAMNSAGKTILVVQGIHQIGLYDSEGYLAYDDIGGQVVYWWWTEDSDGNDEFYTESSDFIEIVNKIYDSGHFADYITEFYYVDTYGDNYYSYVPGWLKDSVSWLD